MTDNNHFDPKIFLFTMIFPTVSDVSIYNSPSAPQSTVAVLRMPSVETKLPAVMEVCSLQEFDRIFLLINSSPFLLTFL